MDQKRSEEPIDPEVHDTEPPTAMCAKKGKNAGHVLHCDEPLDHPGPCSWQRDHEP
jgi:hypothetical protein